MDDFKLGIRVRLLRESDPLRSLPSQWLHGRVVGGGWISRARMTPIVLVELDEGFYSKDNRSYVTILAVSPDNLEEVE